ncbi:MAG: flavodoxin family protein [Promethearchaeota archaeon]
MKALVVYYSRTGTTRKIGEAISQEMDADIDEIIDQKERIGKLNYIRSARDAKGLKLTKIQFQKNPKDYDIIIIGTPIWWGHLTPAVRTYLTKFDLKGKQVALFITSQGEDRDAVFAQIRELLPESEIIGTFGILQETVNNGEFEEEVKAFTELLAKLYH